MRAGACAGQWLPAFIVVLFVQEALDRALGECSQLAHTASVSHTEAQMPCLDPDSRANKALNLLDSLQGVAQLKTVANNTLVWSIYPVLLPRACVLSKVKLL